MLNPKIIYEDENFLAIDKPAGLLVHKISGAGSQPSKEPTLVDWVLKKYPEVKGVGDVPEVRPGIVHRLDKDTSGVILIARNQEYFEYLKSLFQNHQVKKIYLALVWGKLRGESGVVNKSISLKSGSVKRTVWEGKMEKEAITEYKLIKSLKLNGEQDLSLLEITPKTGRTHQIRVHLAAIGHPVVGDKLYGRKRTDHFINKERQFLHAESVEFPVSDGKMIKIEAELPEDLSNILSGLT